MIPREKHSRGTSNTSNVTNLDDVRRAKAKAQAEANPEQAHTASIAIKDDRHGNRRFDAEKVARLKAAIAAGEYKINPSRIADKFIDHDRNQ